MELKTNKTLLAALLLSTLTLAGCGLDSSDNQSGSPEPDQPVSAAKDSDRDGVADTEDAKPFDAQVSARSVTEYFDDAGNLIVTSTYEIRADGKITAEESVYAAGSDQTSLRAEIRYTDSGEVASIRIDEAIDGSTDFTLTNTYQDELLVRQVSSGTDLFALNSESQNQQIPVLRLYEDLNLGDIDVLRRTGTTRFEFNAQGNLVAKETDFKSDGSIEISEMSTYDSADRKIGVVFELDDPLFEIEFTSEQALIYAGDNPLPVSELLVTPSSVNQNNYRFDAEGRVILMTRRLARTRFDQVSPDELEALNAASTPETQQALKEDYAADFAVFSGGANYFNLLYRSTYLNGLVDSGSLELKPAEQASISYDQSGNATYVVQPEGLDFWLVIDKNARDQITAYGLDNNQDGQIDNLFRENTYNDQGFLIRSRVPELITETRIWPEELIQINYGTFGPTSGSLTLSSRAPSAANFKVTYDQRGIVSNYNLSLGNLINTSSFGALSHRYEGRSQINPTRLNLLVFGLSKEPDFGKLINLTVPGVGGPVVGEVGDPVIGEPLDPVPPVVVNPGSPQVPVADCFGGLSFC